MNKYILCLLVAILTGCSTEIAATFMCPPCDQSCDITKFNHDGPCPTCGMELTQMGTYDEKLSRQQIEEDLQILHQTLLSNHPGLYDYQTKDDFSTIFKSLMTQAASAKSVMDEYLLASQLIAAVSDAHTYVMHPYYQKVLQEELLFPLIPKIDGNQIFIEGRRVRSVNGHSEARILSRLQLFANSDGSTIPYKNAFVEMEFPLKYFTFLDKASAFEIVFENEEMKTMQGKSYFMKGLRPKVVAPTFQILGDSALLKIPDWEDETAGSFNQNLTEMEQVSDLGKFIGQSMKALIAAKSKRLIIDLRGNKGGKSGPAAILLSYLIDQPFKYYSEIQVLSDTFPTKEFISNKALVEFYESDDARQLIEEVGGAYFFKEALLPLILPKADQFTGEVELLVDKYTLSVSTDLVAILQKNREIVIKGVEIGGSLAHYCAGNYINLVLPNSGIHVNIPLQRLKY